MTDKEALNLALEALEGAKIIGGQRKADEAITAIKEALAAPVQEPVAWAWRAYDPDEGHNGKWKSWKLSDYEPPRQPDRWFQVVPLPHATPPAAAD